MREKKVNKSGQFSETKRLNGQLNAWYDQITHALSSNYFFYGIIVLAVLQGLWYALSVAPGMYDEGTHLGYIFMYTHHASPFITHQSPQYDYLGETTRNGSYLFYYLMSLPARLISLLTSNTTAAIVFLRLLMIATFGFALYLYRKVFLAMTVPKSIAHLGLLLVILIPMLAPEPGVVNYDSATFLLTAVLLLLAVQVVQSDEVSLIRLALLLVVGLSGSEVKFEFVAIAAPVLLFVAYDQANRHGKKFWPLIRREASRLSKATVTALTVALIMALGLFIERPVYNLVRYHDVNGVHCTKIMSLERCLQNPIETRNFDTQQQMPPAFRPLNPITFTSSIWAPTIVGTLIIVLAGVRVLFVPALFYYALLYGGVAVILLYLRKFLRERSNQLLLLASVVYVMGLLTFNYQTYVSLGAAFAENGRYLLPVLPIFVTFVLIALRKLAATRYPRTALASLLLGLLILLTQGGGIATAVLTIPPTFYWHNTAVHEFNHGFQNVLHHIAFERNPFNEPFH